MKNKTEIMKSVSGIANKTVMKLKSTALRFSLWLALQELL